MVELHTTDKRTHMNILAASCKYIAKQLIAHLYPRQWEATTWCRRQTELESTFPNRLILRQEEKKRLRGFPTLQTGRAKSQLSPTWKSRPNLDFGHLPWNHLFRRRRIRVFSSSCGIPQFRCVYQVIDKDPIQSAELNSPSQRHREVSQSTTRFRRRRTQPNCSRLPILQSRRKKRIICLRIQREQLTRSRENTPPVRTLEWASDEGDREVASPLSSSASPTASRCPSDGASSVDVATFSEGKGRVFTITSARRVFWLRRGFVVPQRKPRTRLPPISKGFAEKPPSGECRCSSSISTVCSGT